MNLTAGWVHAGAAHVRVAFSLFLARWQANFRAGGRPAKADKAAAEKPAEPAADKTPPTE